MKKKPKNRTYELSKKIRKPMPPPVQRHKSIKDYDRKKEQKVCWEDYLPTSTTQGNKE